MKGIFFLLFFILMSCNDYNIEVKEKIQFQSLQKFNNGTPKFDLSINLDSLKNTLSNIDSREEIYTTPHTVIYNEKHQSWIPPLRKKLDSVNDNHRWRLFYSFQEFGKYSLIDETRKNQIGYEVFGKEKDVINEININLNIYTPYIRESVLQYYFERIKGTLRTLNIQLPIDLETNVKKGRLYYFENDQYYLMLNRHDKKESSRMMNTSKAYNYETFKFIIKSK